MKIYFAHSTKFDFGEEFYQPFEKSRLANKYELILPHKTDEFKNSKEIIKNVDLVVAEVTYPSVGLGVELGWAEVYKVPVVAVYKSDSNPSRSLKVVTNIFVEYSSAKDLVEQTEKVIEKLQSPQE